jgi:hypothetical protein
LKEDRGLRPAAPLILFAGFFLLVLATAPAAAQATPPPENPPPQAGSGGSQATNYFNPSISVIGNFLAVAGQNQVENLPNADLRESEVGLQAIVDPYGRADFFLSFGEQGVEVEEGFLTLTSLPAGLLAKVGRMRVSFGKINTLHLHVLPWPDAPLPIVNLLGGEEGWIGTGVSLAKLLPLPGDTFSEITAQVFRGDSPGLFVARKRSDLAYNGHYRIFRDLSDSTNLDLGFSYGQGPNGTAPDAVTRLEAIDATFRWKPLVRGNYKSVSEGRGLSQPARPARRQANRPGVVRLGRVPARQALVHGSAPRVVRPCRRFRQARHRRRRDADLLAERVLTGSRRIPAPPLRRLSGRAGDLHGQRAPSPAAICDRRARRPSVLTSERKEQ